MPVGFWIVMFTNYTELRDTVLEMVIIYLNWVNTKTNAPPDEYKNFYGLETDS
jgi:hypothetical protein